MLNLPAPSSSLCLYDFPVVMDQVRKIRAWIMAALQKGGTRAACEAVARATGGEIGGSTLHKKLVLWIDSERNDTVLIDKRLFPEMWAKRAKEQELPEKFLIWAGGQMLSNQRSSAAAYRTIIARWRAWRRGDNSMAIDGYSKPPRDCGKGYPTGWSYENLMRRAQPPKEQLDLVRLGSVAAQKYLPYIPSTRAGVKFLQFVYCDDVVHDRKCSVPGYIEPVRILQLGAIDYASGVYLKFGIRPDLPRDDGTRERLQRRDFLTLIAGLLMDYGYPTGHKMHLICERGTATMNLAEAQFLYELTDGQVCVGYTSMEGQFVLAWDEAKSGCSNGKGLIESWHNLFHNEQASLPGQTGKDRNHTPTALLGSDREVAALNKVAMVLTPQQRARLAMPYPSITQAHRETLRIVQNINHRRDHACEDFEQVQLWRLMGTDMEWREEGELVNVPEKALSALEWLPVQEKPAERMARLSQGIELKKPHPGGLVGFFEGSHSVATVERRQVKITVNGKTCWFGPETPDDALENDTPIMVHHMPQEPEWAIITSKGRYIAIWKRQLLNKADEDTDALSREIKRKQSFLKQTATFVRGKMAEQLLEHERRVTGNADVLAEAMQDSASGHLAEDGGTHTSRGAAAVQELSKRSSGTKKSSADKAARKRQAMADLAAARADKQSTTTVTDEDDEKW